MASAKRCDYCKKFWIPEEPMTIKCPSLDLDGVTHAMKVVVTPMTKQEDGASVVWMPKDICPECIESQLRSALFDPHDERCTPTPV